MNTKYGGDFVLSFSISWEIDKLQIFIQGISEKCTGAFKFGCRITFWGIYLSESCHKRGLFSLFIYRVHKKTNILCFNFLTNINICTRTRYNVYIYIYILKYLRIICISIILNGHYNPLFEDKSSSLTLKYRLLHFSQNSCSWISRQF